MLLVFKLGNVLKHLLPIIRQIITTTAATYALVNVWQALQAKPKPFTGQANLFKDPVHCHPLTMDWLLHLIRENDTSYLNDEKKVLTSVIKTNNEIIEMSKQPEQDYINFAFVATNTPYEEKKVPFSKCCDAQTLDKTLSNNDFAFFQYPTQVPNNSHAVGFSREKDRTNCKFFDPDDFDGEINGPCDKVIQHMAHRFFITGSKNHQPDNTARITVASKMN